MKAHLYVIPGSHPATAARLMLEYKGVAYKRTDLLPVISKGALRAGRLPRHHRAGAEDRGRQGAGFASDRPRARAPAPEPPLFPADPELRTAVEEAERYGDEVMQHPIRQILWWTLKRDKAPLRSYSEGAKLGLPIGLAMKTAAPIVALSARLNEADDESAKKSLEALPAMLDKVDAWIAAGVLGGEQLNAADFQIAPSLRLAMTLDDLRPAIEGRPAGALAMRVVPSYPGHTPPILPAAWLRPLATPASAA